MAERVTARRVSTLRSEALVERWIGWRQVYDGEARGSAVEREAAWVVAVIERELFGRGYQSGGSARAVTAPS